MTKLNLSLRIFRRVGAIFVKDFYNTHKGGVFIIALIRTACSHNMSVWGYVQTYEWVLQL